MFIQGNIEAALKPLPDKPSGGNMALYSTVLQRGQAEQTIEKSRFICYVSPAETKEEAELFIAEIRKKHKDATHNVPAMVLGEKKQIQWASDDGEPQGTSGAPIVQMLVANDITNVVVVVTRYFGGIKLGTGGLVRAYTSSAKLGLEASGICDVEERKQFEISVDYPNLAKLQSLSSEGRFVIDNIEYSDKVKLIINCKKSEADGILYLTNNATQGKIILLSEKETILKIKR